MSFGSGALSHQGLQQQYCPTCGQPRGFAFGHVCPPVDPRIMAELKAIHETLDKLANELWTKATTKA